MDGVTTDGQLRLLGGQPVRRKSRAAAAAMPVAQVSVVVAPPHLDHPFDYLVPSRIDDSAKPGCRVRIRFAGRLVDGFILDRYEASKHGGRLAFVERVNGPPIVTPGIIALCRAVADRYAGGLSDLLRVAVPPRHAGAEREVLAELDRPDEVAKVSGPPAQILQSELGFDWDAYPGAAAFRQRLTSRDASRVEAVPDRPLRVGLNLATGDDAVGALADLALAAATVGGVLLIMPDFRMVERLLARLGESLGPVAGRLTGDLGPARRYATQLRIMAGRYRIVVGTRAAVFAPLPEAALVAMWEDGDDTYSEPHTPGWHAREVLAMRSQMEGSALLYASYSRSVEVARMVETGFLKSISIRRESARKRRPKVLAARPALLDDPDSPHTRLPPPVFATIRQGLREGPVLVQVGRSGYAPVVSCARCHAVAKCGECGGPVRIASSAGKADCSWCGKPAAGFTCVGCGGNRLAARVIGAIRTAEELGRAFPQAKVIRSDGDAQVRTEVGAQSALVVATTGAEPPAVGGYSAAVLLDGEAMLSRPDIRAEEQTVRRWFSALALVRGQDQGGVVAVVADPAVRPVQTLLRADPVGWAERELAERESAQLAPAISMVVITGAAPAANRMVADLKQIFPVLQVLGPTKVPVPISRMAAAIGSEAAAVPVPLGVVEPPGWPVPLAATEPAVSMAASTVEGDHRYVLLVPRAFAGPVVAELRTRLVAISAAGKWRIPSVRVDPVSVG